MKRLKPDLPSLSSQMILSVAALVLLTAVAAGLPAIWLIRQQLEQQAWAQLEQGSRAAQALYAARQNELDSLATLTAQRPTLHSLLTQTDRAGLSAYLRTLQNGTNVDLIIVCDSQQQVLARVGQPLPGDPCAAGVPLGFQFVPGEIWLLATHPLESASTPGAVVVGIVLDDDFARQMQAQVGLAHNLLLNGQVVTSSLPHAQLSRTVQPDGRRSLFTVNDQPYYALSFPLDPHLPEKTGATTQLEAEVALAVTDITATQERLAWTLVGGMALVAAVGAGLGIVLARQITRPLAYLTQTALALSQGQLDTPAREVTTRVREVAVVMQALENARIDLQRTLTELRHEKAWTDHLLQAIVEGIATLDHEGRVTFFSPGAERITGWPRHDALHRSIDDIIQPLETDQPFSHFIPPPGRRQKVTVKAAGDREVTLAITGAQLTPPGTDDVWLALVFRDVSEEEVIHRIMGHFLANVSHEFRTPLSALAASVELLLDQAPDLSSDELHELLISLHLGILGLQTLVDNLLESASIEAGRFQVRARPTHPGKIIAEAVRVMQPLLNKHGQQIVLELPVEMPLVRADSRRTGQVLVNLISNASKYGPDEAEITVGLTLDEKWVRVAVADRGQGVAPAHRHDLFRRFVHLDAAGDKTQQYGAGLGLSVVKAIVEAQGGQVGVDDRPGGGSVFWFTLPVEADA